MSTFQLRSWANLGNACAGRDVRSWVSAVRRAARVVSIWHERARQRRQLHLLSDHMLRDIGLTRADLLAEASKPFWQR